MINLNKVGHTLGDLGDFRTAMINAVGDKIFEYPDMQALLYDVLSHISPVNKTLKDNPDSVELACKKVLDYFGFNRIRSVTIRNLTTGKEIETSQTAKTSTLRFLENIIYLDDVPSRPYKRLLKEVNSDLKSLLELIKWYEEQPIIRSGDRPGNHEDRMVYDFYKRCTQELTAIIEFQQQGIKEAAMQEAHHEIFPFMKSIRRVSASFRPRPYHFAEPFSISYFDCRQVDRTWHRLNDFPFDMALELQKLYAEDKPKFYRFYFKQCSKEEHLQKLQYYLPDLPFRNNREPIFKELIRNFKARRWISFYALALPQVEGLFSEMCSVASPDRKSGNSLTDKVNYLRPYYSQSRTYFDYYQYYLPAQRNRFSHTGYDEDFKLKSYDLLVDLIHLLNVFYELDNPLVKIKKAHRKRDSHEFRSFERIIEYFRQVNQLKPQQRKEIRPEIAAFEKDFLKEQCEAEYLCGLALESASSLLSNFKSKLSGSIQNSCSEWASKDFTNIDPEIRSLIKEEFLYKEREIQKLSDVLFLLKNHKKYLPSISKEWHDSLVAYKAEHMTTIELILKVLTTDS